LAFSNSKFYGDILGYAKLNKLIFKLFGQTNSGILSLPFQSATQATMSATQSLSNAVWTKIAFNTVSVNTQSEYNTTLYRFTAKESGVYVVSTNLQFANHNQRTRGVWIYKNGTGTIYRKLQDTESNEATSETYLCLTITINLVAGDYLEIYGYQNRGGTLNVNNLYAWFNVNKIA
jgi:hypothetical protein